MAAVILAAAAAVTLAFTRTVLDRGRRLNVSYVAVSDTLNAIAITGHSGLGAAVVSNRENHLEVTSSEGQVLSVRNFVLTEGTELPPIDQAYTPFQEYQIGRDRHVAHLILPGLTPP